MAESSRLPRPQQSLRPLVPVLNSRAPMIYINGVPGVGKATIAWSLTERLALQGIRSKVWDWSTIVQRPMWIFSECPDRSQTTRLHVRNHVNHWCWRKDMSNVVIICTDFRCTFHSPGVPDMNAFIPWEYKNAAEMSGRSFIPIQVTCQLSTLMFRGTHSERQWPKENKIDVLDWYSRVTLFNFPDAMGPLCLNTDNAWPWMSARAILDHANRFVDFQKWHALPRPERPWQ